MTDRICGACGRPIPLGGSMDCGLDHGIKCPTCDGGKNVVEGYLDCPTCDATGVVDSTNSGEAAK
jgi:DnaJ-class molecular chaperone